MYNATHTNVNMPSVSLIRSICYPEAHGFQVASTRWGCEHEKMALDKYQDMQQLNHVNFNMSSCGFFISTQFPFIGASPDSLVSCDCCGDGCVEVKCPYCHRDNTIASATNDPKFCIQSGKLAENHPYFSQVQTQINVCKKKYCDFCLWTEKDYFCERIFGKPDLWSSYVDKAKSVFMNGVLPEIIGKCFTRVPKLTVHNSNPSQYCYCNGSVVGEMYPCSRNDCKLKFFHLECLNLKNALKKSWVCPDCRNINKKK